MNQDRAVFYMHPYELDTGELAAVKQEYKSIPLKWRLSQFVGRGTIEKKIHKLLSEYKCTSFEREYYSKDSVSAPMNVSTNLNYATKESNNKSPEKIVAKTFYSS